MRGTLLIERPSRRGGEQARQKSGKPKTPPRPHNSSEALQTRLRSSVSVLNGRILRPGSRHSFFEAY